MTDQDEARPRADFHPGFPDEGPAPTVGAALRRAREARGLSLADVAERTKVRPGLLSDIEADAHHRLPALTYSMGFVKAFARTVGLDPAQAAERYRAESQKGDPVPTIVDLQPLEARRLPSRRLVVLATASLVLLLGGFWAWGAGWFTPLPPTDPPSARTTATTAVDRDPLATVPDAMAGRTAPADDPQTLAGAVTLTARDEVWLRVADGRETLFMGTMTPGQVLALPPGRAWTLRTGRAGALEVRVGNRLLPPLGGPAESVRNVELTPEALSARAMPAA